jgi:hypothetical protein
MKRRKNRVTATSAQTHKTGSGLSWPSSLSYIALAAIVACCLCGFFLSAPLPLENRGLFMTHPLGFTAKECLEIITLSKHVGKKLKGATMGGGSRRSDVVWLDRKDPSVVWVYKRLEALVQEADAVWEFGTGKPTDQIQVYCDSCIYIQCVYNNALS